MQGPCQQGCHRLLEIYQFEIFFQKEFIKYLLILGSQHYEDMTRLHSNGTGNTIWVNGGWKEKLQEQQQPNNFMTAGSNPDQGLYAEVGDANSNKSHLMSTFAAPSGGNYRLGPDPAPYATTTLAMQNRIRTMVSKI